MIGAVGIDTVDICRIENAMKRWGDRFVNRLFRQDEIDYCRSRPKPAQHYGARFAAKEACMKCLGRGIGGGMAFRDIETTRNDDGKPGIVLHGRARQVFHREEGTALHLSMTHTAATATAMVVMERKGELPPERGL